MNEFPVQDNIDNQQKTAADAPGKTGHGSSIDLSLDSILAEVRGSSLLDGDITTPNHILEAEAERIWRETTADLLPELTNTQVTEEPEIPIPQSFAVPAPEIEVPQIEIPQKNIPAAFEDPAQQEESEAAADRLITEAYKKYDEKEFFDTYSEPEFDDTNDIPLIITPAEDADKSAKTAPAVPMFADDLTVIDIPIGKDKQETVKPETGKPVEYIRAASEPDYPVQDNTPRVSREALFEQVIMPEDEQLGIQPDADEDTYYQEPRLKDQAVKFARTCNSISQRLLPASIIAVIMALITFVFEAGLLVPYGIGRNLEYAACTLMILQLIVMMLCIDVLIKGADFIACGYPNAESLVLFSCVFSLISATFTVVSGSAQMLPFCAVSALSLVFASFGERSNLRAMTDSIKIAVSSPEPYGVQAEYNVSMDSTVLKKAYCRTDGFYTNLVGQDIIEILYRYATPALLICVLLMTVVNVLINGVVENSLHILSALLAAAVPFSLLLTYPLPFNIVSKALSKNGIAIAGWGGADDISYTDGVCVTDDDLFPPSTLRLSAVKVFDGANPRNVLCYTGSLIIASGSGLTNLFIEALQEQGITPLRVVSFECQESGISAIVQGHKVYTGSAAYMNLIGVRVPDDSNMKNAIFTAVNNRLVAMFTVDYKPLPGVQGALISMLKWHINLFFAMRDFNITPSMVGQKFKVPFEGFVFMSVKDSYAISNPYSGKQGRMAAVLVRESLGPYAEAITSARQLRSATLFATILSIITAGIGILFMFLMLWDGSFLSATPSNLIIYGLCMLVSVLIVCGYVKIKR